MLFARITAFMSENSYKHADSGESAERNILTSLKALERTLNLDEKWSASKIQFLRSISSSTGDGGKRISRS
jgi:hypothetical protein